MKRKTALLLAAALTLSLAGACGDADKGATADNTKDAGQENTDLAGNTDREGSDQGGSDSGEIVEIVWQFPGQTELPEAFYDIENRLNEMMEKDIGVHVTFTPVTLDGSQQSATLMINSGEQLDIMLTANTGVGNLVDQGLIMPLEDYLDEHGQDIVEHCGVRVDMCNYDGHLYGLPTCIEAIYTDYAYNMKKEYVDKYNLEHDDNKVYTLDEMEAMFDTIKAGEGDNFYMVVPWLNTYEPLNGSAFEFDPLSGSISGGVLMLNRGFDDLTVCNMFETEEYKEYCERMYRWAQKGFLPSDAAVDSEFANRGGESNYLGWFGHGAPDSDGLYTNATWGVPVVEYRCVAPYMRLNGGCPITWNIPVTCEHPEKAVEAINYIFKNVDAADLIMRGREGIEYEIVEQDVSPKKWIKYLKEDVSQLEYVNPYGLWGDFFETAELWPSDVLTQEKKRQLQENLPKERYSGALGYSFKTTDVSSEIAAVEAVMQQYCYSLNAGALDPQQVLPEFIDALKAAGIDKIIAENQRQLDEWAAANK